MKGGMFVPSYVGENHKLSAMFFFKGSLKRNIDVSLENFLSSFTVKNKYGEMAATITVIFASVYIGWAYAKRGCVRKKKARAVLTRSMSLGALHGGKLALERMVDYHRAREDEASLEAAEIQLRDLLAEEHPDFKNLQSVVAKLEMSGKDEAAVRILETELERARKEGKSHEDFGKALACECLRHEEISDARRSLYKAIIHIMSQHPREEALKCFEEFKDIQSRFQSPSSLQQSQIDKMVTNFNDFEKEIKFFGKEINEARMQLIHK
uniref:Uncharacterized protein n=1 Tax=Salix viminalis TaxID=40686 RepID=A0A6N2KF80_SALVM